MGAHGRSGTTGRGRAGRHRRSGQALIERRDHRDARPERRFSLPSPAPSALVGIAVLVLIGIGVIHLSSAGSAVPLEDEKPAAAGDPSPGGEDSGLDGGDDEPASDADGGSEGPGEPPSGPSDSSDAGDAGNAGGSETTEPGDRSTGADGDRSGEGTDPSGGLVVHVAGAVESPGVVTLPEGSRVDDALQAAGGATSEADLSAVNLARPVADGEQIHVPRPGEDPPSVPAPSAAGSGSADTEGSGGSGSGSGSTAPVDLNTADAADLEQLPGVGPAISQRIIEHRDKNGPFESVDELLEVSGIGPATLEKIREHASV
ncbi:helix-hairpin-helix domain-containing protein [Brachybacterium sp. GCM10030267]|uniref:helix-hairpin-helix domain-containing protein n=1 Tax=Brachybacterium sp. GCM10030267 TaxID=3273381 RepID=UPI00360794BF